MSRFIEIKGAAANNLKQIDAQIPHGKITVITGVSGSGKSTLAFDTLYAEGQRRFIESMSSYARQFLGKLEKPKVDYIKGLSPAIAIQQKVISSNPRSTVGTTTEIYDFLKLLFAREGKTYSPISNQEVLKDTPSSILSAILSHEDSPFAVLSPIKVNPKRSAQEELQILANEGFIRIYLNNKITLISDITELAPCEEITVVVDRFKTTQLTEQEQAQLIDSIQMAFAKNGGTCGILNMTSQEITWFNNRFERDGMTFQEPSLHFFTFNNPFGACKTCEGFGSVLGIDPNLVIPDPNVSIYEGAIHPWKGETMGEYLQQLLVQAHKFEFPVHKPYRLLTPAQQEILWEGNSYFTGLREFFKFLESQTYKIQYRVMLSRYRGKTLCQECQGTRLRGDASYVKFHGKSLQEVVLMPVSKLHGFFEEAQESIPTNNVLKRLLPEIIQRIRFLNEVGLGYLSLNRSTNTLSGGESQRIHLATSLGSSLVGSTYVLDEPSIGLHPRDTKNLIRVLNSLKEIGNTLVIVEHEEEVIKSADHLIDIGPFAGENGGTVVFQGDLSAFKKTKGLTANYFNGTTRIQSPSSRRKASYSIRLSNANLHNLKDVHIEIPLRQLVCLSGVSGSGKSTLLKTLCYPAIKQALFDTKNTLYRGCTLSGDINKIKEIELIDQNPIGKSSRSNPITYLKIFDEIRDLYARQPLAKNRNYKPGFFSFNVEGGRCDACDGEGIVTIGMQFMADIQLTCETCQGTRFKEETLEIVYRQKSIADLLEMTLDDLSSFFHESSDKKEKHIASMIQPLLDVGLGYLRAGQASSTLSGGEAQRIKLASFLAKGNNQAPTLFLFDEPSTGLHYYDIEKLLQSFQALIANGHSIVVIEHNLDIIKTADHVIDIGPEGGEGGGKIVFTGTPEDLVTRTDNYTGIALAEKGLN